MNTQKANRRRSTRRVGTSRPRVDPILLVVLSMVLAVGCSDEEEFDAADASVHSHSLTHEWNVHETPSQSATHLPSTQVPQLAPNVAPDRLILKLRARPAGLSNSQSGTTTGEVSVDQVLAQHRVLRVNALHTHGFSQPALAQTLGLDRHILVEFDPLTSNINTLEVQLRQLSAVEWVERDGIGKGASIPPGDSSYATQWHLENRAQNGGVIDADIDAEAGWALQTGDPSVRVAVLDTGISYTHTEFQGRLGAGHDFVNNDSDPTADHNHGIYCTGLLAANANNAWSGAGVDWGATILPVKVLDAANRGFTTNLGSGIVWASDNGAHVISMSLIDYPCGSDMLRDSLLYARGVGSILIASAGNNGIGNADVSGPGCYDSTISVGSTNNQDRRASSSATGVRLDIVAPGSGVLTANPSGQNSMASFSGTSAAAPVVAGATSLMVASYPGLSHDDAYRILTTTAEDLVGNPAEDTFGRDNFHGHGRLNLAAALALAICESPTTPCGDGLVCGNEGCDDGNTTPGDGCSAACQPEFGYVCQGQPSVCMAGCGDGQVAANEGCDDNNMNAGDGCSPACQPEHGFACSGTPSVCTAQCGDGLVASTEACDDGNVNFGDGCSAGCQIEAGFQCVGEASSCSAICGDGMQTGSEGCDDGNQDNGDGCDANCVLETVQMDDADLSTDMTPPDLATDMNEPTDIENTDIGNTDTTSDTSGEDVPQMDISNTDIPNTVDISSDGGNQDTAVNTDAMADTSTHPDVQGSDVHSGQDVQAMDAGPIVQPPLQAEGSPGCGCSVAKRPGQGRLPWGIAIFGFAFTIIRRQRKKRDVGDPRQPIDRCEPRGIAHKGAKVPKGQARPHTVSATTQG